VTYLNRVHRKTAKGELAEGCQFSLMSIREAQRIVVRARGRLVLGHGADEHLWVSQLDHSAATNLALDVSCVSDLDARGLGLLATLVRITRERGTTVSVIAASRVQRLGKMTGVDQALHGTWSERTRVFRCGARPSSLHSAGRRSVVGVCGAAAYSQPSSGWPRESERNAHA
jgi:anti-anti-sigma regulatory factor